jgi:hypothetical protein
MYVYNPSPYKNVMCKMTDPSATAINRELKTTLNLNHFKMVEATGLKITALRSP